TSWSSTTSTFASTATICRRSENGAGLADVAERLSAATLKRAPAAGGLTAVFMPIGFPVVVLSRALDRTSHLGPFHELTDMLAFDAGGIRLVGIEMHLERKARIDPHDDITERQIAALAVDAHFDDVVVAHAEAARILGAHVYVSACRDDTVWNGRRPFRSFDCDAGRIGQIARDPHGCIDPEHEFVCARYLDLVVVARRAHQTHAADASARADERDSLLSSVLTGLRKHVTHRQPIARTEQLVERRLREVSMPRGYRHRNT